MIFYSIVINMIPYCLRSFNNVCRTWKQIFTDLWRRQVHQVQWDKSLLLGPVDPWKLSQNDSNFATSWTFSKHFQDGTKTGFWTSCVSTEKFDFPYPWMYLKICLLRIYEVCYWIRKWQYQLEWCFQKNSSHSLLVKPNLRIHRKAKYEIQLNLIILVVTFLPPVSPSVKIALNWSLWTTEKCWYPMFVQAVVPAPSNGIDGGPQDAVAHNIMVPVSLDQLTG